MRRNPLNSWSLRFLRDQTRKMTLGSALRYLHYAIRGGADQGRPGRLLRLRMRWPMACNLWLRTKGADIYTFNEIIVNDVYGFCKNINNIKYIIDIGANIGIATRLFAAQYPGCRIMAVEPDRDNYALLQKNVGS